MLCLQGGDLLATGLTLALAEHRSPGGGLDVIGPLHIGDRAGSALLQCFTRRVAGRFGWLRFLKPDNPQEALALVLLASALFAAGGAAFQALKATTASDRWNIRADRACLGAGRNLSDAIYSAEEMRILIEESEDTLVELREIRNSVPIEMLLQYNSMIADKERVMRLMGRHLERSREGLPIESLESRIRSEFSELGIYSGDAIELGLHVCGQGSGLQ